MVDAQSNSDVYLPQINDKLQFLRESIDEVLAQLQKRQQQKQDFMNELEQKLCEVQTSMYFLDQLGDVRANQMSRRRIHLERQLKKLEQEKRQQELEYWRDITALQKELRQLKKEYRAVKSGLFGLKDNQEDNHEYIRQKSPFSKGEFLQGELCSEQKR
jgi:GMP synthase PP-ATPase subunit